MRVLKGGVIGFGSVGQSLTEYINRFKREEAQIVAACNRGKEKLELAREKYGLRTTHDVSELLHMDIDFVLVLSSNYAHPEQVALAAKAGKHIFCEKPIALNLQDADRMIEAVEASGVINVVNYSLRFREPYLKIKELLDGGVLGTPLSVWNFRSRGYGFYSAGARHNAIMNTAESGGWTVHHACHGIDLLCFLNGPIKSVYSGMKASVPESDSEEIVLGTFVFDNGSIGMLGDSSGCIREEYSGIMGTAGSVILSGEGDKAVIRLHREGKEEACVPLSGEQHTSNGIDHFLECVRKNEQSPNSIKSARHSLAVALAMKESATTGAEVDVK